jgi:hypothetical protein
MTLSKKSKNLMLFFTKNKHINYVNQTIKTNDYKQTKNNKQTNKQRNNNKQTQNNK